MSPWERYRADLEDPEFVPDSAQEEAVRCLDDLYRRLLDPPPAPRLSLARRLLGGSPPRRQPQTGLYMWGGVGRGKTYLMDTFYGCLPFAQKRRLHFHRFMGDVHRARKAMGKGRDPLPRIARSWAEDCRVLCFDEFFVSDIADAMILSGLLQGLFQEGVTLVATSNIPPESLYKDGLQRARFLPAIDLLARHTRVLNVDGGTDYRLRFMEQAEIYHYPLDEAADRVLEDDFRHIAPEAGEAGATLVVEGRSIPTRRLADSAVWFEFEALCDGPRSQADYMEIARQFHTVVISNVPLFDPQREDQARRFISLVDEFYDRGVKLVISAQAAPEDLYRGKRLAFEFERTTSRLVEMQSHDYLAAAHRP